MTLRARILALSLGALLAACAFEEAGGADRQPQPQAQAEELKTVKITPAQAERLQRIMSPLIAKMNNPIPAKEVKMTILADDDINAANGGGGDFYVTSGLLQKGGDAQLLGIMAHEVAHADLGHVAKTQRLATGLELGIILLDQIYPGSRALSPIAGQLVINAYSRGEEHEADAHAVTLMNRAGHNGRQVMASTLRWLSQTAGDGGGGFFATHPATGDRIKAVENLQ
jgi:predicted Zn-dependent protease